VTQGQQMTAQQNIKQASSRLHTNLLHNFMKHSPKYDLPTSLCKELGITNFLLRTHLYEQGQTDKCIFPFLPQVHAISVPFESNIHQLVNKFGKGSLLEKK
jgi:hypothetical protein